VDSAIIAGLAALAALPSDRLPSLVELYTALKAFAYAFLTQLAIEHGIKPYYYSKKKQR
jgi:hypothetical protein